MVTPQEPMIILPRPVAGPFDDILAMLAKDAAEQKVPGENKPKEEPCKEP